MKKTSISAMLPAYCIVLSLFLLIGMLGNRAITVMQENAPLENRICVIIDAGHGGVDGGASTANGVPESQINLQIALRLNDFMHLLGLKTYMIRTTDISIHTQGNTIAAKKISDLKQRVKIVNETENAFLISIHQNYFSDSQYRGAQVFYTTDGRSEAIAKNMQAALVKSLNPGSRRQAKRAEGVYLMQHIENSGILIECGFLSHPEESRLLQTPEYQKKLCSVICAVTSRYFSENNAVT